MINNKKKNFSVSNKIEPLDRPEKIYVLLEEKKDVSVSFKNSSWY
jgi:hypothetical protein